MDAQQSTSNQFVRALMTFVCQSAIICEYAPHRTKRAPLDMSSGHRNRPLIVVFVDAPQGDNPYKVDVKQISQRGSLLLKYLSDEPKELQALYALQALMVHMEQPASRWSLTSRGF